jgi:hypothetical protein
MTPLCLVMVAIAQALAWLSAPPKSLAAAADREAIRRQVTGPSVGSYNNDNLSVDREAAVEPAVAAPSVNQQSIEPVEPRGESWWRQRVATIRSKITRDEEQVAARELEIPRLDGQAVSRDDPAQQASLRKQGSDARSELETLRTSVGAARRELSALLEEARRLDVPPGWLR